MDAVRLQAAVEVAAVPTVTLVFMKELRSRHVARQVILPSAAQ
jgi:hypothetical protein